MTDRAANSWTAYAGSRCRGDLRLHVDVNERTVRAYGETEIQPVTLIEDPAGPYFGWVYADRPERGVVMIQPHEGMFEMQFPYGPEAEQRSGKGRIVRMRLEVNDAGGSNGTS